MYTEGYLFFRSSGDGKTLYLQVKHSFDFRLQKHFREACDTGKYERYVVDFSQTTYIDSAALGMLMILYRKTGNNKDAVHITGCSEAILQILKIAHFIDYFDIAGLGDAELQVA